MKNFKNWASLLCLLVVMPFVFSSCSDDKDDDKSDNGNTGGSSYATLIIGTWSDTGDDDWNSEDYYNDSFGFEFFRNGMCNVHHSSLSVGKYTLRGNVLTIKYDTDYYYDDTEKYTILQLTNSKLVLEDEYGDKETYYRVNKSL